MSTIFEFVGGSIGVMPDPEDNPDNHVVTYYEAGTDINFETHNVGDAGNNARVGTDIDDTFATVPESQYLDPGQSEADYVSLGRLNGGQHTVLIYVNPGSWQPDHGTNTFTVG